MKTFVPALVCSFVSQVNGFRTSRSAFTRLCSPKITGSYPPAISLRTNPTTDCITFLSMSSNNEDNGETSPVQILSDLIGSNPTKSLYFSSFMAICGAALGPFLDSYHSLFGVLSYDTPLTFSLLGNDCVTTYWVPPLFGLAGFLIGWLYISLDAVVYESEDGCLHRLRPSVPKVFFGISYFTFQYWLSGILFARDVGRSSILIIMSLLSAAGFYALDGTLSGFITSMATAIGGPLIEVGLISSLPGSWAYHYNDAGETGFFPLWIIPVYFLGGPANGNLARAFWNAGHPSGPTGNKEDRATQTRKQIPCLECQGTRAVPCPNCDDGTYVTYGERVLCKACRGKGRVICRSCFSKYGDDPNDIESIRKLMDRIPD